MSINNHFPFCLRERFHSLTQTVFEAPFGLLKFTQICIQIIIQAITHRHTDALAHKIGAIPRENVFIAIPHLFLRYRLLLKSPSSSPHSSSFLLIKFCSLIVRASSSNLQGDPCATMEEDIWPMAAGQGSDIGQWWILAPASPFLSPLPADHSLSSSREDRRIDESKVNVSSCAQDYWFSESDGLSMRLFVCADTQRE